MTAFSQLFTLTRLAPEAAIYGYRPGRHSANFVDAGLMRMEGPLQESVKFLEWTYA